MSYGQTYQILVVDDQPSILDALKILLSSGRLEGETVRSPGVALHCISQHQYDALLLDRNYARYKGNVSQAAEGLGLSRGTFYRRTEKYGLYAPQRGNKEKQ